VQHKLTLAIPTTSLRDYRLVCTSKGPAPQVVQEVGGVPG